VRVEQTLGDDRKYGYQNTDSSRSIRHSAEPMRHLGAAMRTADAAREVVALQRSASSAIAAPARSRSSICATSRNAIFGATGKRIRSLPIGNQLSI
jgi:isoquinoline 1-oxidoreductase subunit beta